MAKAARATRPTSGASSQTADDGREIKIQVDYAKLADWSLDDLAALESSQSVDALMNLLDGVVIGGVRGKGYKVRHLKAIQDALMEAVAQMGNPADASGKA